MIIKLTKGKILDITAVAFLLSLTLGISFANMGEFPYTEKLEIENLLASGIYVLFIILFVYLSALLGRKRLMIFNTVWFTVSLLFSVWYFAATTSTAFIPSSLSGIFSLLNYIFHTQLIGIYYLIDPIDRVIYGTSAFLVCFIVAALSWFFLLRDCGYFDRLISSLPRKEKKERISKAERLRREIKEEKKQRTSSEKGKRNG